MHQDRQIAQKLSCDLDRGRQDHCRNPHRSYDNLPDEQRRSSSSQRQDDGPQLPQV
jgi:hypothetical protein